MATPDQETPVTYFANPFLKCDQCQRRAVGMVGTAAVQAGQSGIIKVELPVSGRNWPCYHVATRSSVCDNWTSTTGCQHGMEQRAQHSNQLRFEGTRK